MKMIIITIFLLTGCKQVSDLSNQVKDRIDQMSIESKECSAQPEHSSGGVQTSLDNGQTWTGCYGLICDSGYILSEKQDSCIVKTTP